MNYMSILFFHPVCKMGDNFKSKTEEEFIAWNTI